MKKFSFVILVLLIASTAFAADTVIGGKVSTVTIAGGRGTDGGAYPINLDADGNIGVVLEQGTAFEFPDGGVDFALIQVQGQDSGYPVTVSDVWASSLLSAGAGDVLPTAAPSGACNASGYQLTAQDATVRILFHDCTTAHTVTQWTCLSTAVWAPGGQVTTSPGTQCAFSLALDHVAGPLYLQSDMVDGGVGSAITVDVSKAVSP